MVVYLVSCNVYIKKPFIIITNKKYKKMGAFLVNVYSRNDEE